MCPDVSQPNVPLSCHQEQPTNAVCQVPAGRQASKQTKPQQSPFAHLPMASSSYIITNTVITSFTIIHKYPTPAAVPCAISPVGPETCKSCPPRQNSASLSLTVPLAATANLTTSHQSLAPHPLVMRPSPRPFAVAVAVTGLLRRSIGPPSLTQPAMPASQPASLWRLVLSLLCLNIPQQFRPHVHALNRGWCTSLIVRPLSRPRVCKTAPLLAPSRPVSPNNEPAHPP